MAEESSKDIRLAVTPRFMELRDGLDSIMKEIESDSHRATAVVAGAFVQERLLHAISGRLQDNKLYNELFTPGRAIGDFGTQINLGYLMGVYTKAAKRELDTIRKLRNDFAQKMEVNNFETQKISAICANLKIWETVRIIADVTKFKSGGQLEITIGQYDGELNNEIFTILDERKDNLSAKDRYTRSCMFYVSAFSLIKHQPIQLPAPIF
jgi:hypothetical protein